MQAILLEAEGAGGAAMFAQFLPIILIIAVFYFMLIRPQKKREKKEQEMRNALDVGDEIITVGGIIGTVITVKDEYLIIETGSDRSKLRIARWAVRANNTPKEAPATPEVKESKRSKKEKEPGEA